MNRKCNHFEEEGYHNEQGYTALIESCDIHGIDADCDNCNDFKERKND